MDNTLTDKILNKVALLAENNLKSTLKQALPLLTVLTILSALTLRHLIVKLIGKGVVVIITDFNFGEDIFFTHVVKCAELIWTESEKKWLITSAAFSTAATAIAVKYNIISFPGRLREIKKLKFH